MMGRERQGEGQASGQPGVADRGIYNKVQLSASMERIKLTNSFFQAAKLLSVRRINGLLA